MSRTPWTHFRRRFWCCSRKPAACGCATRWARGCIRSLIGRRLALARRPRGGDVMSEMRPRCGSRPHAEVVDEVSRALHQEIERLPEYYRVPVVLCELEGRSHEQAARHLGWPLGTVKSRLARGRDRLRDRLTRRGLEPTAGLLLPARLPEHFAQFVPPSLIESTTRVVLDSAAARVPAGAAALVLAQGVLKTMALARGRKWLPQHFCSEQRSRASFLSCRNRPPVWKRSFRTTSPSSRSSRASSV